VRVLCVICMYSSRYLGNVCNMNFHDLAVRYTNLTSVCLEHKCTHRTWIYYVRIMYRYTKEHTYIYIHYIICTSHIHKHICIHTYIHKHSTHIPVANPTGKSHGRVHNALRIHLVTPPAIQAIKSQPSNMLSVVITTI
jgi:hypothetical protein